MSDATALAATPRVKGVTGSRGPIVYVYVMRSEARPTPEAVERLRHHLVAKGACTFRMVSTVNLEYFDKLVVLAVEYNRKTACTVDLAEALVGRALLNAPTLCAGAELCAARPPAATGKKRDERRRPVNRTSLRRAYAASFG